MYNEVWGCIGIFLVDLNNFIFNVIDFLGIWVGKFWFGKIEKNFMYGLFYILIDFKFFFVYLN